MERIYSRFFPHRGQNFASSSRTCPHFGQTLVMGLFRGTSCCGLLTIRYKSSPSTLRKKTIIAQSAPFICRVSASLYTHTRIKRPNKNQRNGIRKKTENNNHTIHHCIYLFCFVLKYFLQTLIMPKILDI